MVLGTWREGETEREREGKGKGQVHFLIFPTNHTYSVAFSILVGGGSSIHRMHSDIRLSFFFPLSFLHHCMGG